MAKFLVTVALLMAVAFAAKQITIMNYAQDGCTGTVNASKVDVDTCFAYKYENWTAMKFGFPRDLPVATIYPDASANCTTLGNAVYVPCGRCAYSGRPEVGYYRYLCDVKRQAIRADLECNSDRCDSCAHHFDIKVGECTKYANGTKNVQIGALGRMSAIPEIMFDNPNATCTFHTAINIYDVVCSKCLGRTIFNCTLTDGGVDKKVSGHPLKPHLGQF